MQSKLLKEWTGEEVFYEKHFRAGLITVIHQKGEVSIFQSGSLSQCRQCFEEILKSHSKVIEIKFALPFAWQSELTELILPLKAKLKGEFYQGEIEILVKGFPARLFIASSHKGQEQASPSSPTATPKEVKVLIVDDSPTIQKVMRKALENNPPFKVMHVASNAEEALAFLAREKPDVMTLDINMPGMSGVELLKKLNGKVPPTVLVTGLSMNEGPLVLEALECGAIDYIQKPEMIALEGFKYQLTERLLVASMARRTSAPGAGSKAQSAPAYNPSGDLSSYPSIVAIGASTGGTEAIKNLLKTLPSKFPPIVIVQHIPPVFSKAFADRLNQILPFKVSEARDGDRVAPGEVLIAPGGIHMRVVKKGHECYVALDAQTPERTGHRPSVDVLLESVSKEYPEHAIGILLTGMGADGAQGLLQMKETGSLTINQDEETSVVYGMPKKAKMLGASVHELALLKIGPFVSTEISKRIKK